MSVRITEIFIEMRKLLQTHQKLYKQIEKINNKVSGHNKQITLIFKYLKQLEQVKHQEFEKNWLQKKK